MLLTDFQDINLTVLFKKTNIPRNKLVKFLAEFEEIKG